VASGSKVGSHKYKFMNASTNEEYAPTIKSKVPTSKVPEGINAMYEIVIDGVDLHSVKKAMKEGIEAACGVPGVKMISAGNYGGKLGPYQIRLHELFHI
jgi:formylmethanofuran--tetrahydromethanopterin N-formyltransferase